MRVVMAESRITRNSPELSHRLSRVYDANGHEKVFEGEKWIFGVWGKTIRVDPLSGVCRGESMTTAFRGCCSEAGGAGGRRQRGQKFLPRNLALHAVQRYSSKRALVMVADTDVVLFVGFLRRSEVCCCHQSSSSTSSSYVSNFSALGWSLFRAVWSAFNSFFVQNFVLIFPLSCPFPYSQQLKANQWSVFSRQQTLSTSDP